MSCPSEFRSYRTAIAVGDDSSKRSRGRTLTGVLKDKEHENPRQYRAQRKAKVATRRKAKVAKNKPLSTRLRIINRSILLFNRQGVQNVSIEQIASDLQLSRGNLNYHFRRKRDLITAILDMLDERLRVALARPVAVASPTDAGEYLIRLMHTLWDFRFFFNGLMYLLTHYPPLRKRYAELRDWVLDSAEGDIRYLAERGFFLPPKSHNTYRLLVENIWGLWLNWLRMTQIENPFAPKPEKQALYDCVTHFWSLCHLWLEPGFARQLRDAFKTLLSEGADPKRHTSARTNAGNLRRRRPSKP